MRETAAGVVSGVFQITGRGWVLEVPVASLEGQIYRGNLVRCPAVETRRTVVVEDLVIPRTQGEPCVAVVIGEVRESLVRSWLHQNVIFEASGPESITGTDVQFHPV